jgi:hypothetical protein
MRTEAEAIEYSKRSPRSRASAEVLAHLGMKIVGDQPGQRFMAFAEGENAELVAVAMRNGASPAELAEIRNIAEVMRDAPGAQRSQAPIDFPWLGRRFATLVPLAVVRETLMRPRTHAYAFGVRETKSNRDRPSWPRGTIAANQLKRVKVLTKNVW